MKLIVIFWSSMGPVGRTSVIHDPYLSSDADGTPLSAVKKYKPTGNLTLSVNVFLHSASLGKGNKDK